jgi:hypothetical protein
MGTLYLLCDPPFYKRYTASTDGMSRGQGTELEMVVEEHARSNLNCYLVIGLQYVREHTGTLVRTPSLRVEI